MAIDIAIQTLHGLEAIHEAGIIHRDISPENIMVFKEPSGALRVKVIDLGIAKSEAVDGAVTRTGMFVGKWKYASPEHLGFLPEGQGIDGRADLFSFGIVLYEMLSGRAPYEATTPGQYFILHSKETPNPVTLHNLSFPEAPGLEKILARALEKDREQRYPTAKEFAKALSVLLAKLEEIDLEATAVFQSATGSTLPQTAAGIDSTAPIPRPKAAPTQAQTPVLAPTVVEAKTAAAAPPAVELAATIAEKRPTAPPPQVAPPQAAATPAARPAVEPPLIKTPPVAPQPAARPKSSPRHDRRGGDRRRARPRAGGGGTLLGVQPAGRGHARAGRGNDRGAGGDRCRRGRRARHRRPAGGPGLAAGDGHRGAGSAAGRADRGRAAAVPRRPPACVHAAAGVADPEAGSDADARVAGASRRDSARANRAASDDHAGGRRHEAARAGDAAGRGEPPGDGCQEDAAAGQPAAPRPIPRRPTRPQEGGAPPAAGGVSPAAAAAAAGATTAPKPPAPGTAAAGDLIPDAGSLGWRSKALTASPEWKSGFQRGIIKNYEDMYSGSPANWAAVAPGVKLSTFKIVVGRLLNLSGLERPEITAAFPAGLQTAIDEEVGTKGTVVVNAQVAVVAAVDDDKQGHAIVVEMIFRDPQGKILAKLHHRTEGRDFEGAVEDMVTELTEFVADHPVARR